MVSKVSMAVCSWSCLALLDERADPVGLRAVAAAFAHARDHLFAALFRNQLGHHRRAARRHLVDHRHVEVGEVAHGERARDRRGAHHELVRLAAALRGERQALLDAEAVLLVHDGEPELRERDPFLEERVGADGELRLRARDGVERRLLLARLEAAREPRDLHAERFQPMGELEVVLLGEDLRGRHEGRLPAVLDRLQRGERRHERLATAHVALQEPAHRVRLREVLRDDRLRVALRAREREGQRAHERVGERVRVGKRRGALRAPLAVGHAHRELLREQLVELETAPRRMRALLEAGGVDLGRGTMEEEHALAEAAEAKLREELLVERVLEREVIERICDLLAQSRLRQPRGRRVYGRERLGKRRVLADDAVARVHHLVAEEAGTHLAEEPHAPAGRELLRLARIEIEEPDPQLVVALVQLHHEGAARAELHVRLDDLGFHERGHPGAHFLQRREAGLVLVAQRQVQDEVELRADAELFQARVEARLRARRGGDLHAPGVDPRCITASISTSAPRGSEATPIAARAGNGARKYVAITSFSLAKLARSVR